MRYSFHSLLTALIAGFAWLSAWGASPETTELTCTTAEVGNCLQLFNQNRDVLHRAAWFKVWDVDGDGQAELVLTTPDRDRRVAYRPGPIPQIVPIQSLTDDGSTEEGVLWIPVHSMFTMDITAKDDPTIEQYPLMLTEVNKKSNRFKIVFDAYNMPNTSALPPVEAYTNMFFKHHVSNVRKKSMDGNSVTFSLEDPSRAGVMMRGYPDGQIVPMVVTDKFLENHYLCEYTRWLEGERVDEAGGAHLEAIEAYFAPMKVYQTRWLATCDELQTTFYSVTFRPEGENAFAAFIAIRDNTVTSVRLDMVENISVEDLWYGSDIDSYFEHAPQIMAIARTPAGTELYVRWYSMEGAHRAVWREVAGTWLDIIDNYEYFQ